ncbi:MAG: discoidin domain-containing protein [Myxococcota bacterium]
MKARLATGAPGCIAISSDGQRALVVSEHKTGERMERSLAWVRVGPEPAPGQLDLGTCSKADADEAKQPVDAFCRKHFAEGAADTLQDGDLKELLTHGPWIACATVPGDGTARPMGKPVTVTASNDSGSAVVAHAGKLAFTVFATEVYPGEQATERVMVKALHYAESVPALFVERVMVPREDGEADDYALALDAVPGMPLGLGGCLPRPRATRFVADPDPGTGTACGAMTKDGRAAVFHLGESNSEVADEPGKDEPAFKTTESWEWKWVGPDAKVGQALKLDFDKLYAAAGDAHGADTLDAALKKAGLIPCPSVGRNLSIDGHLATLTTDGALWLEVDGRMQWLRDWAGGMDGSDHESFTTAYQVPDGPVYVEIDNEDTMRHGTHLAWYDVGAGLGICPKEEASVMLGLALKDAVSGPTHDDDATYTFGPKNLIDGRLGTSWQPLAKTGEASIEVVLATPGPVAAVEIANGFQRQDALGDLFALNARAKTATLTFSDGSRETMTFAADARGFVRKDFAPRTTSSIRITITEAYPGGRWKDDLALSEVRVFGP